MERLCIYEEDVERSKKDRGEGRDELERMCIDEEDVGRSKEECCDVKL